MNNEKLLTQQIAETLIILGFQGFFKKSEEEQKELIDMVVKGLESSINKYDTKLMGYLMYKERNDSFIERLTKHDEFEVVYALKQANIKIEEKYKQITLIEELCQH
jgi:mannitol/fructose-specific phosphotransferase system IIA component (Ntr-type)